MRSKSPPIICDTNIWYEVGSGQITKEQLADKMLIGTFVSGYELGSSFNAINNYTEYRKAVIAFLRAGYCCTDSPVEHIKGISGYASDDSMWKVVEKALNAVVQHETIPFTEAARQIFEDHQAQNVQTNRPMQELVKEFRQLISNRGKYKRDLSTPQAKQYNLNLSIEILTNQVMNGKVVDWDQFELFVLTFNEWLFQLAVQPTLTITSNDWNDLLNLVYVQPGSLYWTRDKKKTKKFIHLAGCAHYLLDN